MALERDHDSAFQSYIITIFVGSKKKRFTAHKEYLTKCDFFTACLERSFKEGIAGEINLPEDDPDTIDILLHFLYHDKLPGYLHGTLDLPMNKTDYMFLTKSYATAGKYCVEELQNKILDLLAEWCKHRCFLAHTITMLTDADMVDSKLRRLLLQNVAHSLVLFGYEKHCEQDKGLASFVSAGGVDSVDLLRATLTLTLMPDREDPAHVENTCELYHVHNKTKKCEKAEE